jgi:hypothetical protein
VTENGQMAAIIVICINRIPVVLLRRAERAVVHLRNQVVLHRRNRPERPAVLPAVQVRLPAARQKRVLPRRKAVQVPMMMDMRQSTRMMIMIGTDIGRTATMQVAWMMQWKIWIGKSKENFG